MDYFTVCGICKKRLTRNHMYALGPETEDLNQSLSDDGIPVRLSDKLFLCKLCRYYGSLRLKYRDPSSMSSTHRLFLNSYRKKLVKHEWKAVFLAKNIYIVIDIKNNSNCEFKFGLINYKSIYIICV